MAAARNATTNKSPKNGRARIAALVRQDHRHADGSRSARTADRELRLARRQRRLEGSASPRPKAAGRTGPADAHRPRRDLRGDLPDRRPRRDDAALFTSPYLEEEKYSIDECKEKGKTYAAPLYVNAEFMNHLTGEIKTQTVFMGDFPLMTEKGTFIINGTERVVVSQLVRSPGRLLRPHAREDRPTRTSTPLASSRAVVPGSSSRSTSATRSAFASTASASSPSPCSSRPSA